MVDINKMVMPIVVMVLGNVMAIKAKQNKRDPEAAPPLTPAVFHIMLALADGESHGYSLMAQVDTLSAGRLQLGPGTLYRSIQRMLVDELIEEVIDARGATPVDERRRNYRLTRFGRQVAQAEARRLELLVEAATARGLLPKKSVKAAGRR
jgi:DNA-binding PadR family transcriptional regulator